MNFHKQGTKKAVLIVLVGMICVGLLLPSFAGIIYSLGQ